MLLGSRTATRIRFGCVRFSGCPWRDAVGLAGLRVGSGRGAWWFENWIVDASNAGLLSCLLYRDFARLLFWSLVSRSIVL